MGYNWGIGEAEPEVFLEDRVAYMSVRTENGKALGAPLNAGDDYGNWSDPPYLVGYNFIKAMGLYSVFYAPRCPVCDDPDRPCRTHAWESGECPVCHGTSLWWVDDEGEEHDGLLDPRSRKCSELTEAHYRAFKKALDDYEALPEEKRAEHTEDGRNNVHRRLQWLVFWTRWALDNCEYPSFAHH